MAITAGARAASSARPAIPGQSDALIPVFKKKPARLSGQRYDSDYSPYMIAFDAGGNVRWTVPNDWPKIATEDGGVIGASGVIYDQNGGATGQISNAPAYSWFGNSYQVGSHQHYRHDC